MAFNLNKILIKNIQMKFFKNSKANGSADTNSENFGMSTSLFTRRDMNTIYGQRRRKKNSMKNTVKTLKCKKTKRKTHHRM